MGCRPKKQLSDYADHLKELAAKKRWLLIYLGKNEPSDDSISKEKREALANSGNFKCLDFYSLIGWLYDCAAQSKSLVVRVFIEELAKFVQININGDLEMSEEKEVIGEIRKSQENITAAFHITNAITVLKQQFLQEFKEKLESQLKEKGFHLVWDTQMSQGWTSWVGFSVVFVDQQDKYLRIEFEGSGLSKMFWGIRRNEDTKREDYIWQEVNNVMRKQFRNHRYSDYWPWYSVAPDSVFDKDYKHWGISEKPWIEMDNGKLVTKIVGLADQVFNLFQESKKIHLLQAKAD